MKICELIEDYGLVGFETLAVEDKKSMLHLMRTVDRALGYAFVTDPSTTAMDFPSPDAPGTQGDNRHALPSTTAGLFPDAPKVQDVQERWVDAREAYDQWELVEWQKEGTRVAYVERKKEREQTNASTSTTQS